MDLQYFRICSSNIDININIIWQLPQDGTCRAKGLQHKSHGNIDLEAACDTTLEFWHRMPILMLCDVQGEQWVLLTRSTSRLQS